MVLNLINIQEIISQIILLVLNHFLMENTLNFILMMERHLKNINLLLHFAITLGKLTKEKKLLQIFKELKKAINFI